VDGGGLTAAQSTQAPGERQHPTSKLLQEVVTVIAAVESRLNEMFTRLADKLERQEEKRLKLASTVLNQNGAIHAVKTTARAAGQQIRRSGERRYRLSSSSKRKGEDSGSARSGEDVLP